MVTVEEDPIKEAKEDDNMNNDIQNLYLDNFFTELVSPKSKKKTPINCLRSSSPSKALRASPSIQRP